MSPFDRIAQLTQQLAEAREQAARDSATIQRLSSERDALNAELANARDAIAEARGQTLNKRTTEGGAK